LTARFNEEKQGLLQRLREEEDRQHALRNDNERLTALNQQAYLDAENWKRKYEQSEKQRLADIDIMRQDYERRVRESPVTTLKLYNLINPHNRLDNLLLDKPENLKKELINFLLKSKDFKII